MVNILSWNDSLATGFKEVDLQHKKLIAIIDSVFQTIKEYDPDYALKMAKILKQLTDYTEYHFSEEEQLMKRNGYTGYEGHKSQHDGFISKVGKEIQLLAEASPDDGYLFYRFLGTWLLDHIAKSDHAWAEWLTARGVQG